MASLYTNVINDLSAIRYTEAANPVFMDTVVIYDNSKFAPSKLNDYLYPVVTNFIETVNKSSANIDGIIRVSNGTEFIPLSKLEENKDTLFNSKQEELSLAMLLDFLNSFMKNSVLQGGLSVVLVLFGHQTQETMVDLVEKYQQLNNFSNKMEFHVIGVGKEHDSYLCDRFIRTFSGSYNIVSGDTDVTDIDNNKAALIAGEIATHLTAVTKQLSVYSVKTYKYMYGNAPLNFRRFLSPDKTQVTNYVFGRIYSEDLTPPIEVATAGPLNILENKLYYVFMQLYYHLQFLTVNLDTDGILRISKTIDEIRANFESIDFSDIISNKQLRYLKCMHEKLADIIKLVDEIAILIAQINVDENISKDSIVSLHIKICKQMHSIINGTYVDDEIISLDMNLKTNEIEVIDLSNESPVKIPMEYALTNSTLCIHADDAVRKMLQTYSRYTSAQFIDALQKLVFQPKTALINEIIDIAKNVYNLPDNIYSKENIIKDIDNLNNLNDQRKNVYNIRHVLVFARIYEINIRPDQLLMCIEEELRRIKSTTDVLSFIHFREFLHTGVEVHINNFTNYVKEHLSDNDTMFVHKIGKTASSNNSLPKFIANKLTIEDITSLIGLIYENKSVLPDVLKGFYSNYWKFIDLTTTFDDFVNYHTLELFAMQLQHIVFPDRALFQSIARLKEKLAELNIAGDTFPYLFDETTDIYSDFIYSGGKQRAYVFILNTITKHIKLYVEEKERKILAAKMDNIDIYELFATTTAENAAGILKGIKFGRPEFDQFAVRLYQTHARFIKDKLSMLINGTYDGIVLIDNIDKIKYTDALAMYSGKWRPSEKYVNKYLTNYCGEVAMDDFIELFPHFEEKIRKKYQTKK